MEDRKASTALVVFNAALSREVEEVPNFSGLKLAVNLGVNLIALSDPLLENKNISVAWYLGDSQTGPLRDLIASVINHVLADLGSAGTIFLCASGGEFAAGHTAALFPDSITLLVNPGLSLERKSRQKMKVYLNEVHGVCSDGFIGEKERVILQVH